MIIIGKPINGIYLNGLEYLLDDNDKPIEFATVELAKNHLQSNGFGELSDDELEDSFVFLNN